MITTYTEFLVRKKPSIRAMGLSVTCSDVNPMLYEWQRKIVSWAVNIGRAAIWADTGLGKTLMQLEWIRIVSGNGIGLIVAPLAVCQQTIREASKIGLIIRYARNDDGLDGGIYITNYEMFDRFDASKIAAVVLDEASILKQSDGKTRTKLIEHFRNVQYRLACTATPAPNEPVELTSQAEFIGVSTRVNMLASYFVHDADGWRMKGHAKRPMFEWMSTWAVAIRKPSDMGYPDGDFNLPGLKITSQIVDVDIKPVDDFFARDIGGVGGRARVRKETLEARCRRAASIVMAEPDEPWVIWCGLNDEASLLQSIIPDSVNVHGSLSPDEKADMLLGFADGRIGRLITKPSIAAMGLNWQHCARMIFVGMSDSYEAYYQSIRRCYRYGQQRIVEAHIVLSELECVIADNVFSKEREFSQIIENMVRSMNRKGEIANGN